MANNGDIVVMNDRLRMAVGNALSASPKDIQEAARRRRNSLDSVMPSSGSGAVEYSGYFALRLVENSGAYRVRVVDGATYDDDAGTSGTSTARVNNVTFNVAYYESGDLTDTSIFALRYTKATNVLEVVNLLALGLTSLPNDSKTVTYYQLGRAILSAGEWTIAQDHTIGVVQMWYYLLCTE